MWLKAVIFDLYGTLVDNFRIRELENMMSEMAEALSAPRDDFARMWVDTFSQRATGGFTTTEVNIEYVCRTLGCHPTSAQIKKGSNIYLYYIKKLTLNPRPKVLKVLAQLKSDGYKIGVITDCSPEVPSLWPHTPFASSVDVAVFSCVEGVKKPNPEIYIAACQRLKFTPQQCLYVGDGSSKELTGAAAVGMQPLLLRTPSEKDDDFYRIDVDEWTEPSITDLTEILTLIKSAKKNRNYLKY